MEANVSTKLIINLKDGILDVNGSEEFVRSIYEDFKGEVAMRISLPPVGPRQIASEAIAPPTQIEIPVDKVKPIRTRRASNLGEGTKAKYKPKFDANLDVNGLVEYYAAVVPENNAENILTFAMFLKEHREMESVTADHIFTCFYTVRDRTKIPEAFEQSFRNTQHRTHYIQVNSMQDISVTIPGSNHFEEMKKRKAAA
jgi:hypothetical protein